MPHHQQGLIYIDHSSRIRFCVGSMGHLSYI